MASLQQQLVEQLASLVAASANRTSSPDAPPMTSAPHGPLDFMTAMFKAFFSASALRDWAVLLVIGSLFETARRSLASLWHWLINSFFVTAVFDDEDISFQWIMLWLSKQPSWKGARNVQVSTSNFDLHAAQMDNGDANVHARKITLLPAVSESYTLWYNYRWMSVTRAIESHRGGWSTRETLKISIMTRDHGVLADILQNAKNEYIEAQKNKIAIFVSDRYNSGNGWRELATRPKRPLNSIILDPGIMDLVVEDVQDFLDSKGWYAERGIPFRRGYLLYGAPGSGKTSLIHSIAGELGLNVYIVSLSRSGLDDTGLAELISALPERCIALMEDIDAAFHHGLSRESPQASTSQAPDEADQPHDMPPTGPPVPTGNRVSLSGLLNALDGIGAQEGRVLFATTNKYGSLDPALCRPGRMDLHIEFKLASRFQAEELFKRFYAPSSSCPVSAASPTSNATRATREDGSTDGGRSGDRDDEDTQSRDLIDLSEPQTLPTAFAPTSVAHWAPPLSEKADERERGPQTPTYVGESHRARAPVLSLGRIHDLAAAFARAVPERQLSMASLQGFLMMYKTRPVGAVEAIGAWVEREMREMEERTRADR